MDLATFETRVRLRLSDGNDFFPNIAETLDEWIESNYQFLISHRQEYFLTTSDLPSVALQENYDILTAAPTFKSMYFIKRSDLTEKPLLRPENIKEQDYWRGVPAILYRRNGALNVGLETWTMIEPTVLRIIPAPPDGNTYEMWYFRKHLTAVAPGDPVDIYDEMLPVAILAVAYEVALMQNDPVADRLNGILQTKKRDLDISLMTGREILGTARSWPR